MTLLKKPQSSRSQVLENSNPNKSTSVSNSVQKMNHSPVIKSVNKSTPRGLKQILSPYNKVQERKFLVAKKNSKSGLNSKSNDLCNCKHTNIVVDIKKCTFVANQNLQTSQDVILQSPNSNENVPVELINGFNETDDGSPSMAIQSNGSISETPIGKSNGSFSKIPFEPASEEFELSSEMGSAKLKRRRDKLLEEARESVPEPGFGRVRHLVKAFERLLSIPSKKGLKEEENEERKRRMKWALPGLQSPSKLNETVESVSSYSFSPSEPPLFTSVNETADSASSYSFSPSEQQLFTSENLGLDLDSSNSTSQGRSVNTQLGSPCHSCKSSRTSGGSRRSQRTTSDSSGSFGGSSWKKRQQLTVTSQKPFKLRTEQRGRDKEQDFVQKRQQMLIEEEKRRNHVARGLPWTIDQPEFLVKPPVKESTKPINMKLHSDIRAMERAEFDHYVAEKLSLLEQYKLEQERLQKLEEEEELKIIRKELVPRAQRMPFFDRPFIPKRNQLFLESQSFIFLSTRRSNVCHGVILIDIHRHQH